MFRQSWIERVTDVSCISLLQLTIRELGASLRSAANAGARQANEMVDEAAHEAQETISWA